jgi:glycosyltransferase involved in cell wall biosynthesis
MNLLIDAHIFDEATTEGVTIYLQGLYSSVIALEHNIKIFFAAYDINKLKSIFGTHNNVVYLAYKSRNKYYRLAFELPYIIKNNKIDIAHFQYVLPLVKCCKEIVTIHDILFYDFPQYFPYSYRISKNILYHKSAKRTDLLFTVSEYSRQAISKNYKIDRNKIYITPNAVSEDFYTNSVTSELFEIKNKYNFDKYILYVSRIEPRKNHINLAKAYIKTGLWEENIKLVFAGKVSISDKKYHYFYNSLKKELQDTIIHIPQLSHSELLSIYKGASLFVYPSIAEGFGIPPLEAAASGVPCLCSRNTAMSDFDFFGEGLFNPYDIDELKQKITNVFNNSFRQDTICIQSMVHNKYNWMKIADTFLEIIKNK